MKVILIFSLIGLLFVSCSYTEKDLLGVYTPMNYENTFDTIQLKEHNVYYRKVYDINNKFLLEMNGRWELEGGFIKFKSFYLNLDDDLVSYPENVQDTTGGWGGDLNRRGSVIEFCVGHLSASLSDQNCYQKQ